LGFGRQRDEKYYFLGTKFFSSKNQATVLGGGSQKFIFFERKVIY